MRCAITSDVAFSVLSAFICVYRRPLAVLVRDTTLAVKRRLAQPHPQPLAGDVGSRNFGRRSGRACPPGGPHRGRNGEKFVPQRLENQCGRSQMESPTHASPSASQYKPECFKQNSSILSDFLPPARQPAARRTMAPRLIALAAGRDGASIASASRTACPSDLPFLTRIPTRISVICLCSLTNLG